MDIYTQRASLHFALCIVQNVGMHVTMATAVSTPSAMQFHLLVLGIAICLSCFATPVVHSSYEETCQTYPVDSSVAVNTHNVLRSKVHPTSSNMRRIVRLYC